MDVMWIVVAAAAWLTVAIVNAGVADARRRSKAAWFGASLLLGPIASVLLVVRHSGPARMAGPALAGHAHTELADAEPALVAPALAADGPEATPAP